MYAQRQLTELAERKRLLVLQADLHRALMRAEFVGARERLRWLSEAQSEVRAAGPWLAAGAAATGLVAASRWRTLARWIPAAFTAWRWVNRLKAG